MLSWVGGWHFYFSTARLTAYLCIGNRTRLGGRCTLKDSRLETPMTEHTPNDGSMAQRIAESFQRHPRQMTPLVAEKLGVTEAQVIRHLPNAASTELDPARWEEILRSFESFGTVYVIVNSGTVAIEVEGRFGGFSRSGIYFNVQSGSLDMHIRHERLGEIFAVEKTSHMDGIPTLSVQLFEKTGRSALKIFFSFGGSPPSGEIRESFDRLVDTFRVSR